VPERTDGSEPAARENVRYGSFIPDDQHAIRHAVNSHDASRRSIREAGRSVKSVFGIEEGAKWRDAGDAGTEENQGEHAQRARKCQKRGCPPHESGSDLTHRSWNGIDVATESRARGLVLFAVYVAVTVGGRSIHTEAPQKLVGRIGVIARAARVWIVLECRRAVRVAQRERRTRSNDGAHYGRSVFVAHVLPIEPVTILPEVHLSKQEQRRLQIRIQALTYDLHGAHRLLGPYDGLVFRRHWNEHGRACDYRVQAIDCHGRRGIEDHDVVIRSRLQRLPGPVHVRGLVQPTHVSGKRTDRKSVG